VIHADGAGTSFEPVNAIVASAGATHPLSSWLDALRLGGRLLFPMTTLRDGPGAMLLVARSSKDGFAARFLCRAGFIDFRGARDPALSRRLAAALRRNFGAPVRSLRRDTHGEDETCWLHEEGWCLSRHKADGQL
jgi:protein-L-isoaspartate(D-aspartate) O-methyltransferase